MLAPPFAGAALEEALTCFDGGVVFEIPPLIFDTPIGLDWIRDDTAGLTPPTAFRGANKRK